MMLMGTDQQRDGDARINRDSHLRPPSMRAEPLTARPLRIQVEVRIQDLLAVRAAPEPADPLLELVTTRLCLRGFVRRTGGRPTMSQ
jgi:hypothetical protein